MPTVPSRSVYERQATHTRVRLKIGSFNGDGFSGEVTNAHPEFGQILSVQTNKAMGAPAGKFTIQVKKPQIPGSLGASGNVDLVVPGTGEPNSWLRFWDDPEGAWILVQWICDGQVIDGMLGQIDTVSENTVFAGGGAKSEVYSIQGSDFGKIFEQTITFVNIYDNSAALGRTSFYQRLQGSLDGPPGRLVAGLLEAWIGNYTGSATQSWYMPEEFGGGTFYDLLQKRIGCQLGDVDGYLFDATLLDPDRGANSLWQLLQEYANPTMNEMFVDLAPPREGDVRTSLRPTITLRRYPFKTKNDTEKWDALPLHELQPADINNRKLSKGGPAQRFNYWMIDLDGRQPIELQAILQGKGASDGFPGSIPIWNLSSIERHGVRLWRKGSAFLPALVRNPEGAVEGGDFVAMAGVWLRRLHDWHCVAPMELSGSLGTSRLRPEIRIGHKVIEHRAEGSIEYYVEGVTNSWAAGGAGQTTITVTRGEYESDDLLGRVYEELENRVSISESIVAVDASEDITGEGLVGDDADRSGLVSEGSTVEEGITRGTEQSIAFIDDWESPSELDARRAYRGERQQTLPELEGFLREGDGPPPEFTETELEGGFTIPVDELLGELEDL